LSFSSSLSILSIPPLVHGNFVYPRPEVAPNNTPKNSISLAFFLCLKLRSFASRNFQAATGEPPTKSGHPPPLPFPPLPPQTPPCVHCSLVIFLHLRNSPGFSVVLGPGLPLWYLFDSSPPGVYNLPCLFPGEKNPNFFRVALMVLAPFFFFLNCSPIPVFLFPIHCLEVHLEAPPFPPNSSFRVPLIVLLNSCRLFLRSTKRTPGSLPPSFAHFPFCGSKNSRAWQTQKSNFFMYFLPKRPCFLPFPSFFFKRLA